MRYLTVLLLLVSASAAGAHEHNRYFTFGDVQHRIEPKEPTATPRTAATGVRPTSPIRRAIR